MTPGRVFSSPVDERGTGFLPRFEDRGGGAGASSVIGSSLMLTLGRALLDEGTGFPGIVRRAVLEFSDGGVEGRSGASEEAVAKTVFAEFRTRESGSDVGGSGNS